MGKITFTKKELIEFSRLLAKGLDPITKSSFSSDTILNDTRIKTYHMEIYRLLKRNVELIDKKCNLMFDKENLTISQFVKKINEITKGNVFTRNITNQLLRDGYLEEYDFGFFVSRIPTKKGNAIGITVKYKENNNGKYSVNYYDAKAQKFIYDTYINIL